MHMQDGSALRVNRGINKLHSLKYWRKALCAVPATAPFGTGLCRILDRTSENSPSTYSGE